MTDSEIEIRDAKAKYKEHLVNGQQYSISKFDDQILYISTGALVLSLSFIGSAVSLEKSIFVLALYLSWILLVATSMISIYTHYTSYLLHGKQIERLERNEELVESDKETTRKNLMMFWMLVTGISLQILFVIINIQNMKTKNNNTSENKVFSPSRNTSLIDTIKVPSSGDYEQLGLPVMQVPVSLRPPIDSTSGNKK